MHFVLMGFLFIFLIVLFFVLKWFYGFQNHEYMEEYVVSKENKKDDTHKCYFV
jgi:Na+-transporting methylmalonyl-CoA/oxaloacetate decarboxylase gamma subunit